MVSPYKSVFCGLHKNGHGKKGGCLSTFRKKKKEKQKKKKKQRLANFVEKKHVVF